MQSCDTFTGDYEWATFCRWHNGKIPPIFGHVTGVCIIDCIFKGQSHRGYERLPTTHNQKRCRSPKTIGEHWPPQKMVQSHLIWVATIADRSYYQWATVGRNWRGRRRLVVGRLATGLRWAAIIVRWSAIVMGWLATVGDMVVIIVRWSVIVVGTSPDKHGHGDVHRSTDAEGWQTS